MRIIILIPLILFSSIWNITGQNKYEKRHERMKSVKIAFITAELDLTEDQAEKFWPLYNTYQKKFHDFRREERKIIRNYLKQKDSLPTIDESKAKNIIENITQIKTAIYINEKEFQEKLKKVLSFKKILKLEVAEKEFHRKLIRRLKGKRKN